MDADFWHNKWTRGEVGFHEGAPNALLMAHVSRLNLTKGQRIFLPLCGKTVDIFWLLDAGYRVVGAELSKLAVDELFTTLNVEPEISQQGDLLHYSASGIDVFVGDIFLLTQKQLGPVDAIYDRAAMVALPKIMRARYAAHLIEITQSAQQLLIAFDYDQTQLNGPPFAVIESELKSLYAEAYQLKAQEKRSVDGKLKGTVEALEIAWHLTAIN